MILTQGDNYFRLNESTEFLALMQSLFEQAAPGTTETWDYILGDEFGYPGRQGYEISEFHFDHLPKGTTFTNVTLARAGMKMSAPGEDFQTVGSINNFIAKGDLYIINIPSHITGNFISIGDGIMSHIPTKGNMYDESFRSDIAAANYYFPLPNNQVRTDTQTLTAAEKYKCCLPMLVPDMEYDRRTIRKVFPDLISKFDAEGSSHHGKILHETYFCV